MSGLILYLWTLGALAALAFAAWLRHRLRPHAFAWLARSYEAEARECIDRAAWCVLEAERYRKLQGE